MIEVHEINDLLYKLANSDDKIPSFLSTTLIPYISFVCDGLDYFHTGNKNIHLESDLRSNLFHYSIVNIPHEVFGEKGNVFKQIIEYSTRNTFEEFDNLISEELDKYHELVNHISF